MIFPNQRRSGNHTSNPQWFYVLIHFPFFWVCKVGITGNLKRRTRQNSERVFGFWLPVAAIWIPYAFELEQRILRQSRKWACTIFGKGGVELRPVWVGLLAAGLVYVLGIIKWCAIAVAIYLMFCFAETVK